MKLNNILQWHALFYGLITFIGVYVLGGMLVIFSLSILPENMDTQCPMLILRVGGYLALAFPAYVAARAVDNNIMFHSLLMGCLEGIGIVFLMMDTFSFDGSLQQSVIARMLPVFLGVMFLSFLAGSLAKNVSEKESKAGVRS